MADVGGAAAARKARPEGLRAKPHHLQAELFDDVCAGGEGAATEQAAAAAGEGVGDQRAGQDADTQAAGVDYVDRAWFPPLGG